MVISHGAILLATPPLSLFLSITLHPLRAPEPGIVGKITAKWPASDGKQPAPFLFPSQKSFKTTVRSTWLAVSRNQEVVFRPSVARAEDSKGIALIPLLPNFSSKKGRAWTILDRAIPSESPIRAVLSLHHHMFRHAIRGTCTSSPITIAVGSRLVYGFFSHCFFFRGKGYPFFLEEMDHTPLPVCPLVRGEKRRGKLR